jgi:predicted O-methyltransferase YrrM
LTARLVRRLAKGPDLSFTEDWVTGVSGHWQTLLAEYRDRPGLKMLEIGSYEGASALWFLEHVLTDATATLVCVDTFFSSEPRFDHNMKLSGLAGKVAKLKGLSEELVPQLPLESFDLIYVDGGHKAINVLMDAVLAWRRLKPGGIIIFDDYLWHVEKPAHERPQMALDLFCDLVRDEFDLLLHEYQLILRKKAAGGRSTAR